MIIDYKLTYPSGTATAVLINGFHTPKGDENAKYVLFSFIFVLYFDQIHHLILVVVLTEHFKISGNRFMGSPNSSLSVFFGVSFSGFIQVEASVGFPTFPPLG